jgi:transposase
MQLNDLTDHEWSIVKTHLVQGPRPERTAPRVLRSTINGILWRMRTGNPWRFIPSEYGDWSSIRRRFQQWEQSGVWRSVTIALAEIRSPRRTGRSMNSDIRRGTACEPMRLPQLSA